MGSTVLGLDAGGTFTDCVVLDARTKEVLHAAKTLTTHGDLTGCIGAAFAGLPGHLLRDISMVCLSTTLATNAVVEGRGSREGLVLIGGMPRGTLPTERHAVVQGRYDMLGRLVENLDPAQVASAVESLRGRVDAVAVSGYASVRNPEHERYVKAVVEDRLGVPVVCAHELSTRLGFHERTVTAVLNARLIPMVWHLTDAVREVMRRHGLDAPLMMVRGDGTLMPEGVARSKPIETILSGPAASAIGAVHLSGRSDCLVVDIGGTTTDIAHVSGGRVRTRADGAQVGDWRTQVRAAEVFTVGLGGDSRIHVDGSRRLRIGPERSVSYSRAAADYPHLLEELAAIVSGAAPERLLRPDHEAYILRRDIGTGEATTEQDLVVDALREGPHTVAHLLARIAVPGLGAVLAALTRDGVVDRVSLTPTDVWHVAGRYRPGSTQAAELALEATALMLGLEAAELLDVVQRELRQRLDLSVARAALYMDGQDALLAADGGAEYFLGQLLVDDGSSVLRASFEVAEPVVAIGGPAATWLAAPGGTRLFTHEAPDHADVANAIGAAVAHAVESVEVLIRKDTVRARYLVFSPLGRSTAPTLEEATEIAVRAGEAFLAGVIGVAEIAAAVQTSDVQVSGVAAVGDLFVERVVALSAHLQV